MLAALLVLAAVSQSTDFGVRVPGGANPPLQGKRAPGASFSCSVASITDGDTLRCADGTRIRIAGIDAPEISPCSPGRKCVAGDAQASKRSLASLAAGRVLQCRRVGTSYKRIVAFCSVRGVDLSCAQVRAGQAVKRYEARDEVCRR